MESLRIRQSVRPIRYCLLVSKKNKNSVIEAIELATRLWGGFYFPIVPIWDKRPYTIEEKERVLGIIKDFDPDFIVNLSGFSIPEVISEEYKDFIVSKKEIIPKKEAHEFQRIKGVPVYALVNYYWEKEFKYIRKKKKDVSNVFLPRQGKEVDEYFLFGKFPNDSKLPEVFLKKLNAQEVDPSNFKKTAESIALISPILFTSLELNNQYGGGGFSSHLIYIGNKNNLEDLIEFWNLRASGRTVAFVHHATVSEYKKLIEYAAKKGQYPVNQRVENRTDIQKSVSLSEEEFKNACEWIRQNTQFNLPQRFWRAKWGKERDFVIEDIIPCDLEEGSTSMHVAFDEKSIAPFPFNTPKFLNIDEVKNQRESYSWASRVEISDVWNNEFFLSFPKERFFEKIVQRSLTFSSEQRIGKVGLVFFNQYWQDNILLFPVKTKDVFQGIFEYLEFEISPSPPGRYADGIISFMGGNVHFDCRVFKISGVRQVLQDLGSRKRLTSDDLVSCENILKKIKDGTHAKNDIEELEAFIKSNLPVDIKSLSGNKIKEIISRRWDEDTYKRLHFSSHQSSGEPLTPDICLKYLLEKKVIKPGVHFKCLTCGKEEWYHINDFGQKFTCKYCFSEQDSPLSEGVKWQYKADGLFMLPNVGEGSITSILALWRLVHLEHGGVKYSTSLNIKDKKTTQEYEVDFAAVVKNNFNLGEYEIVLGESKNQIDFSNHEFSKLLKIASRFPKKPYLCFATLKDTFSSKEKAGMEKCLKLGFPILPMTRLDLEPYDLHDRFKSLKNKYAVGLRELSENLKELNL